MGITVELKNESEKEIENYDPYEPEESVEITFSDKIETGIVGIIDLKDSTRITARIPDHIIGKYYSIFLNDISRIIKNHNGTIVKNIGDSILYYFQENKEDEKTCFKKILACSLSMINAREHINQKMRMQRLPEVNFRISLDYGPVITARTMNTTVNDIFGKTVNVCSKMNALCPTNNLLVGGDLYRMLKDRKEFLFKEHQGLKIGVKGEYPTYIATVNQKEINQEIHIQIQNALLGLGVEQLEKVRKKLFEDHNCFITDCCENPAQFINIVNDCYGTEICDEVIRTIINKLEDKSYFEPIREFLSKIEMWRN